MTVTNEGSLSTYGALQHLAGHTFPWCVTCQYSGNKSFERHGNLYIAGKEDTLPKPQKQSSNLEITLTDRMFKEKYSVYMYTVENSSNRWEG